LIFRLLLLDGVNLRSRLRQAGDLGPSTQKRVDLATSEADILQLIIAHRGKVAPKRTPCGPPAHSRQ
jgi:hypothetical protein